IVSLQGAEEMVKEIQAALVQAKKEADGGAYTIQQPAASRKSYRPIADTPPQISEEQLTAYNQELLTWPEHFTAHPKLARILQRRGTTLGPEGGIDWGQAEALACATILASGTPIRLTGQDVERGTFSHRNAVLHSIDSEEVYVPLQHLSDARAS